MLLSVVEVVEVLVDVLLSVSALFLLCRDDPLFPLTVNVDCTTISSNGSPNADFGVSVACEVAATKNITAARHKMRSRRHAILQRRSSKIYGTSK